MLKLEVVGWLYFEEFKENMSRNKGTTKLPLPTFLGTKALDEISEHNLHYYFQDKHVK